VRRALAALLPLAFIACPPVEIVGATCDPGVGCFDTGLVCRNRRCVVPDGGTDPVDSGTTVNDGGSDGGSDAGCVPLKPNVMWVVDLSGSMANAISGDAGPTRLEVLKESTAAVLSAYGSTMRLGLTTFPVDATCGPPSTPQLDVAQVADTDVTALQSHADAVNGVLQTAPVRGGTPTGLTLSMLGGRTTLNDASRQNWVVLITDGLPNCNPVNPHDCDSGMCQCTIVPASGCNTPLFCTNGCLDQSGTLGALSALEAGGIRTIVVGLGPELTGSAALSVLDTMANVGGYERKCPNGTNPECRPSSCISTTRTCTDHYYLAGDAGELTAALDEVMRTLSGPRCP